MTQLPSAYDPDAVEGAVFERWTVGRYFEQPVTEGVPFTVVIPPPNVTGSLHMGHALNNTIQDVVIRRSRMTGRPTRWVVGTDHAGIATQNKVEQKLANEGLSRYDVGRERFVEMCWEWRREHGSVIIEQLKRMGCSCDYADEHFTMDPGYQRAVRQVFVDWFEKGLVYRGKRIINWCPRCATALSDIEVEHEELDSHLWHFRYPLKERVGDREHVVVATTRPETMLGDTCVAVHPDDDRYRDLVGA
ncbi:valine--tRNA ligase, partial [bacterium]|nr:valine--tRNA ligase [bacterium]